MQCFEIGKYPSILNSIHCHPVGAPDLHDTDTWYSKNSQKPSTELYVAFKQTFPHVGPGTTSVTSSAASTETTTVTAAVTETTPKAMDQRCGH